MYIILLLVLWLGGGGGGGGATSVLISSSLLSCSWILKQLYVQQLGVQELLGYMAKQLGQHIKKKSSGLMAKKLIIV